MLLVGVPATCLVLCVMLACCSWRLYAACAIGANLLLSGMLVGWTHAMAQPGYDRSVGDLGLLLHAFVQRTCLVVSVLAVPVAMRLRRWWHRHPPR
ncbi:MAG TPA: hypothetical protein DDZ67_06275 [Xanthomonadaceae bacterium]|nr:hypothetical protein [Xanthomonadaceae bacterium]